MLHNLKPDDQNNVQNSYTSVRGIWTKKYRAVSYIAVEKIIPLNIGYGNFELNSSLATTNKVDYGIILT